ncbi:MAG: hypothetical protein ACXV3U_08450 [Halobacteriota archaeon]
MAYSRHAIARIAFLAVGIFLLIMVVVSGLYAYSYFEQSPPSGSNGLLIVLQVTRICTALGLIGGLAMGINAEA